MGLALAVLGCVRLFLSVVGACSELSCDDFGRFWYATRGWLENGASLYALTPASVADDRLVYLNLNLPSTHFLFLPFALVGLRLAAVCWFVAGALAVALTCRVVAVETGRSVTPTWLLIFLWWMPIHVQAVTGQIAWVILPLVAVGWQFARHEKWGRAGLCIGWLIAIKPFLLPFAAWLLWRRQWRGLAGVAVGAALLTAVGIAVFGVAAYEEWSRVTASVYWYGRSLNASLWGVIYRLFAPNPHFQTLGLPYAALPWLLAAGIGAVVATCWWACRRAADLDVQWSLVMATSLLLSPLGWVYYGVWLLPGLRNTWPGWISTVFWLVPVPWLYAGQPSALATATIGSCATWGLLAAFVYIVRMAHSDPQEATAGL